MHHSSSNRVNVYKVLKCDLIFDYKCWNIYFKHVINS